ncbi:unnamed protein product [Calypogeia fissa]
MSGVSLSRKIAAEFHRASGRRVALHSKLLSNLSGNLKGTSEDGGGGGGVRIGKVFTQEGCFSLDDVQSYTRLTGDSNPIHVSASSAQEAGFDSCLVPGMLCGSLFPAIIGSRFEGAVYVSQDLKFKAPLLVDQPFVAEVEVCTIVKLRQQAKVTFFTRCVRDREEGKSIFVDGQAVALMPMSFIAD